jgi:hypothetical protein
MNEQSGGQGARAAAPSITGTAVAVVLDHQISSQLGEETVILHVEDGVYYGLDPVGTSVWRLLQEPRAVAEIRDLIVEEYEVDPERCERDLDALLRDLAERRLIEVSEPEA